MAGIEMIGSGGRQVVPAAQVEAYKRRGFKLVGEQEEKKPSKPAAVKKKASKKAKKDK